jgi:hypothetical protein
MIISKQTKYFDEVSRRRSTKLSYYQADMNFKLGIFKAIDLKANGWFNALEKSELNKINGESYFNLKQYSNAPSL